MRLLHTSDWHLGRTLYNHDRAWEHQCFLDWLMNTLVEQDIDALLVSGDIFDNANPSATSQHMLYRFLTGARRRVPHLNIILIAGNHDSPGRLEAPSPFLEDLDARIVGYIERDANGKIDIERLVVPLRDRHGNLAAWCLAIPFARINDVPRVDTTGDAYVAGVTALYRETLAYAQTLRQPHQAIIALGHCHMVGGQVSEKSERRIVIGGAEMLSINVFDNDIAYAALGHLHLAQKVGGTEHIRYSGSPLPLSFSEVDYIHQVLKIELQDAQLVGVESIVVPRTVPMLRIPKKHAPIHEVEAALAALECENIAEEARPYLEVRVRLDGPEPNFRARIDSALEKKSVRMARIDALTHQGIHSAEEPTYSLDDLAQLDPLAIFSSTYVAKYGEAPPDALIAAFNELLDTQD